MRSSAYLSYAQYIYSHCAGSEHEPFWRRKRLNLMRKTPKQDRASATVEAILDATARLLESTSGREISTNKVARRAGVSIGTLYQYFANKDELMGSLAKREFKRLSSDIIQQIDRVSVESVPECSRAIVRVLVRLYSSDKMIKRLSNAEYFHRVLVLALLARRGGGGGEEPLMTVIAEALANKLGLVKRMSLEQSKVYSFVLTRSLLGTIRSAMYSDLEMMKSQEFEDQLVIMMTAYIEQA